QKVSAFFEEIKGLPSNERMDRWTEFWRDRIQGYNEMRDVENIGETAVMGDPESLAKLEQVAAPMLEQDAVTRNLIDLLDDPLKMTDDQEALLTRVLMEKDPDLAKEFVQAKAAVGTAGAEQVKDIEKGLEGVLAERIKKADEALDAATAKVKGVLEEDIAVKAVDEAIPAVREEVFVPYSQVAKETEPLPYAITEDTYWYTRGNSALDGIERSAIDQAGKPPLKWGNLPPEAKEAVEGYLKHAQGQMGDARYASTRYAEYKRDAALLNYNRRYKFDTYASMVFPYQFWFTHSAAQWLIHSVD
ncbi:unnamed protein product, partial [marine sediment metagenome]